MKWKGYQEGRQGDVSNELMVKFGNGIDRIVFELLGTGTPFGDSISDTNTVFSGAATATTATNVWACLHFFLIIQIWTLIIIIIKMYEESKSEDLREQKTNESAASKPTPCEVLVAMANQFNWRFWLPFPFFSISSDPSSSSNVRATDILK